jgi:hypothetical protein
MHVEVRIENNVAALDKLGELVHFLRLAARAAIENQ